MLCSRHDHLRSFFVLVLASEPFEKYIVVAVAVLVLVVPAAAVAAVFGKPIPIHVPIVFLGLCLYAMPKVNWVEQYDVFVVRGSNLSLPIPSKHTSTASGIRMHCLRRRNLRVLLVGVVANCIM